VADGVADRALESRSVEFLFDEEIGDPEGGGLEVDLIGGWPVSMMTGAEGREAKPSRMSSDPVCSPNW
jgi:hypothetical protein